MTTKPKLRKISGATGTSKGSAKGYANLIPFKKGQSGNPSGKRKSDMDVEQLAKQHTPQAIAALVMALKYPRERVPAATALLNRGWGMPRQQIAGDANAPLIVDFRWADSTNITEDRVIDAVAEQLAVTFTEDETSE